MIAVAEAPVAGWVPWAVSAVALTALTLYWVWPRVTNRKRARR